MKCKICDTTLKGQQKLFCSRKCQNSHSNFKNQNYANQQKRAKERKLLLMKEKGNKCSTCGYRKNYASLCFHHLEEKSFQLSSREISNRSLDKLRKEVAKCQLLCHNCHMELHNPDCAL